MLKKIQKQKFLRVTNNSFLIGLGGSVLSFLIPLIPCTKSSVIAESQYTLSLCKLPNPFLQQLLNISTKYYGFFTLPLAGIILQFILFTLVSILIHIFIFKNKGKVLDLTSK